MTEILTEIKSILSIEDDSQDKVLNSVISIISSRLSSMIDEDKIPEKLSYIVIEASISRFNRITDEGKTSASESEVSATFQVDDLAPFKGDIDHYIDMKDSKKNNGRFNFY